VSSPTVNGITLSHVQSMDVTINSVKYQLPIPEASSSRNIIIFTGKEIALNLLGNFALFDSVEAMNVENGKVWLIVPGYFSYHGLAEMDYSKSAGDPFAQIHINLLVTYNICDPNIVDPEVAA
jgi:hypothetical protein